MNSVELKTCLAAVAAMAVGLLLTGCSSSPYYGGHGTPVRAKATYVPPEVQRTEPYLPLF